MRRRKNGEFKGIRQELATIGRQASEVWRLIPRRHKMSLGGALAIMSLASWANTAIPIYIGKLIEAVNPEDHSTQSAADLMRVAAVFLGIIGGAYLVREVMNVLRRFLVNDTCTRIDKDMYVRVVSHLLKVDLGVLAQDQVGALYGRITRGVDGLVRFLRVGFLDFVPALFMGTFALSVTLARQPRIALAMAGVIPVSLSLTIWQLITQKGIRLDLLASREAMDGTVVEQLGGIDYIRAANTDRQEVERVERVAEYRRAKELRHHFEMSLFGSGKAINEGFFHLVVLAFAVYLYVHGGIKVGDIIAYSMLYLNVMAPLNEIHRFIDETHESSLRVSDLLGLLAEPLDRSFELSTAAGEPRLVVGEPVIITNQLRVEYRDADGAAKPALNGLTSLIRHGETIGVAGRSGCGKTTWLRTMMRLTHPSGGHATLGGVELSSLSRQSIGNLVGYVGQNPFVFAGTIAENIAYGCEDATEDQIRRAAERACIHDEIMALPGEYRARVAERGQNLSGGQKQRIALARVFLKNPPILILDEGTSALDNISERLVQRAITAARADRTVILVAHRLSTLRDADRILVFDAGTIVEIGTYNELVRQGGVFAELVRSAEEADAASEAQPHSPVDTTPIKLENLAENGRPGPMVTSPIVTSPDR
jgi:ATP-binding cassette, subfamily B, bacterial